MPVGKKIAVKSDGDVAVHAASSLGSYATLCGLSTDDDEERPRPYYTRLTTFLTKKSSAQV